MIETFFTHINSRVFSTILTIEFIVRLFFKILLWIHLMPYVGDYYYDETRRELGRGAFGVVHQGQDRTER